MKTEERIKAGNADTDDSSVRNGTVAVGAGRQISLWR